MSGHEPPRAASGSGVDSITAVAQNYLKAIWSATEWGDVPIGTTGLATRFGTTAANVTDTLKRLAHQGLLLHQPYKPAQLTEAGNRLAIEMVRRHRLIETFLVTTLGYSWEEIHDEAERLEHAVSHQFIERLDDQLGHPTADPHGDPIPDAAGRTERPADTGPLRDAEAGTYLVRRVSDARPQHLAAAGAIGLRPGARLEWRPREVTATVVTGTGLHDLDAETAAAIWVTSV